MREFKISIRENIDYEICLKGFNYDNSVYYDFKSEVILGEQRAKKGEKIQYIYGANIPNEEYLQKEKELMEICEFTHKKHTFQGSFIEALKYINENFKG